MWFSLSPGGFVSLNGGGEIRGKYRGRRHRSKRRRLGRRRELGGKELVAVK